MKVAEFYQLAIDDVQKAFKILRTYNLGNLGGAEHNSPIDQFSIRALLDYIPLSGDTLLCHYIRRGDHNAVRELLYFDASTFIMDVMGYNPLELAIMSNNYDLVYTFVVAGKIPSDSLMLHQNNEKNVMYTAFRYNNLKILHLFMDAYFRTPSYEYLLDQWYDFAIRTLSFNALEYILKRKSTPVNQQSFVHIYNILRKSLENMNSPTRKINLHEKVAECTKILMPYASVSFLDRYMLDTHIYLTWILSDRTCFDDDFKRHIIKEYLKNPSIRTITYSFSFGCIVTEIVNYGMKEEFEKMIALYSGHFKKNSAKRPYHSWSSSMNNVVDYLHRRYTITRDFFYLGVILRTGNMGYKLDDGTLRYIDKCTLSKFYEGLTYFDIAYQALKFEAYVKNTTCRD